MKIRDMSGEFGEGKHVPGNKGHNKTIEGKDYRYTKPGTKKTIMPKTKGQKPITFKSGGLHQSLGVPQGQKIPAGKMAAAMSGRYGPKAKKEALFAKNILKGR